jgi:hypothetical protein
MHTSFLNRLWEEKEKSMLLEKANAGKAALEMKND